MLSWRKISNLFPQTHPHPGPPLEGEGENYFLRVRHKLFDIKGNFHHTGTDLKSVSI